MDFGKDGSEGTVVQSPGVNNSWKNFWLNLTSPAFHRKCSLGPAQPEGGFCAVGSLT